MIQDRPEWSRIVQNGPESSRIVQNRPECIKLHQNRAPELRIKVSYTVFHAEFEFHIGLSQNSLPRVKN